ncbi:MAG: hypothetical protein WDW38_006791 [Sanguina aurantia]
MSSTILSGNMLGNRNAFSILDIVQHAQHASLLHTIADDAATVVSAAADTVSAVAPKAPDFLADTFEGALKFLDDCLEKAGVPYSYGWSIILLTVLVKAATFPLSKTQMESTIGLQALQPAVKELQAKYANSPENLQIETARLYKEAGVNPLAGCLPTLATIPVFIGLYRALSNAADDGLLTNGFFWIPSLGGPATLTDRAAGTGLSWLFPLVDGHPPIGWLPALSYLVMPVLLVLSQYASMQLNAAPPPAEGAKVDEAANTTASVLKFLPLMIGWFSLNVPSGLTLYWFVNNLLSTSQQLYLKANVKPKVPSLAMASSAVLDVSGAQMSAVVKPKEERKPAGKEMGSRKKKASDSELTIDVMPEPQDDGKGKKFRALKAREAAGKAKDVVSSSNNSTQESS